MKGKVCKWNEDKGFGFILSEEYSEKVFFHISDIKTTAKRPQKNDLVFFELTHDAQQRPRAKNVAIEGISKVSSGKNAKRIFIEPPKKTIFDYLVTFVFVIVVTAGGYSFYSEHNPNKLVLYGIGAIITLLILYRQKKPKEKYFTCSACNIVAPFDKRTIQAWNKGIIKLYCQPCHLKWLRNHPDQEVHATRSSGGCLGILISLAMLSVLSALTIYQWLF